MDQRRNVLILCTRNSARSQMAEALLRNHAGDRFNVFSAGLDPDRIHPMVEPVMKEIGLDVSGQRSKDVKEYLGRLTAHYLIVVCASAERNCPKIFPGPGERLYWPFDDPAAAEGTEEQRLEAFRRVRDQIDARLRQWLGDLRQGEETRQE
ncbi:MAG: arsenate reductase ArsC [Thermoguttaceae bacterium]